MFYLSQMLGRPVLDCTGEKLGNVSDLAIQAGQVFPHVTSLAFKGPGGTPLMISWRKYVQSVADDNVTLKVAAQDIRFSFLQPGEILVARDLLNKQIVDTSGLRVVRVNDLKFAPGGAATAQNKNGEHDSGPALPAKFGQYRLLGAEVGVRGLLRNLSPHLERFVVAAARLFGQHINEKLIAWSYMELVDKDLSSVKLAVTHKRLEELHPADIADILEQLEPAQRAAVFDHLDAEQAADTMSELEDEYQSDMIDDMAPKQAAGLLAGMEPDDAADILGGLSYEKAEALLKLMGVGDRQNIRRLLGYKEKTAGGIMTTEFLTLDAQSTVADAVSAIRKAGEDLENAHYVYLVDDQKRLAGTVSLRSLVLAASDAVLADIASTDLVTVGPDEDQEAVAEQISKYSFLSVPVVDEQNKLLGIVTVDDAMDVIEEEHEEDLQIAGAASAGSDGDNQSVPGILKWLLRRNLWLILWVVVALLTLLGGGFGLFAGALCLLPAVLLMADSACSFAISDLLQYSGKGSVRGILRLFARNVAVAVVATAVLTILALILNGAWGSGQTLGGLFGHVLLPALATIFIVLLGCVLITLYGRTRLSKDKEISHTLYAFITMLVAVALQFGLTLLLS
jgi:Mg2+ transporter MgtE